jgi:hypothetical protein
MFTAGVASGFCVDEGLTLMSRCGAVNAGFYGDRAAQGFDASRPARPGRCIQRRAGLLEAQRKHPWQTLFSSSRFPSF